MPSGFRENALVLVWLVLSFASGVAVATLTRADAGDLLAMAGALIGAAASVWGAFAVARNSVTRERREAEELLIKFITDVASAMLFLQRVQAGAMTKVEEVTADERIERILISVPGMANLLIEERLGARTGRARFIGETLRLAHVLKQNASFFEQAARTRSEFKEANGDAALVAVDVPPKVIAGVLEACRQALRQFRSGGYGIAPKTGTDA